jgi:hypothetical protein
MKSEAPASVLLIAASVGFPISYRPADAFVARRAAEPPLVY